MKNLKGIVVEVVNCEKSGSEVVVNLKNSDLKNKKINAFNFNHLIDGISVGDVVMIEKSAIYLKEGIKDYYFVVANSNNKECL
jgi:hypothetical protein